MLREELANILIEDKLVAYYQPIVDLVSAKVYGYEGLIRGPEGSSLFAPSKLFEAAEETGYTSALDYEARKKLITSVSNLGDRYLHINIDPAIINSSQFSTGQTISYLKDNGLDINKIVIELTEYTAINDFDTFKKIIKSYENQGFEIAIDDFGSGHSGIRTLLKLHPNVLKLDMDLIRNIQSDSFKRNLVKSFVKLSEQHNLRLIAEGIESEEELKTLIQIGVRYGQGYFLGMPRAELSELSENVVKIIHNLNYVKKLSEGLVFSTVSTVINAFPSFQISTKTKVVKEFFDSNPNVTSVCILEGDSIVGMVGRFYLYAALSKMYAYDLYANKSIINLTFKSPTIIESSMKLHDAIDIAMNRSIKELYDDFIVINEGKYYGMVTIRNLLINVVDIERQHAVDMNPLTNLPGNKIINKKLDILSSITSDFSVVYFDLNNFKHFNDTYGFEVGDRIIKSFANILKETMMTNDLATSFLGYIGGDDFIVILDSNHDRTVEYINNVFSKFDEFYVNTFNHLESQVRTSIAAAGVFSETFNINLTGELLASKLAEIKKEAKMIRTHNNYVLRTL